MRIFDEIRDSSVERITLLLTSSEAKELLDTLQSLLADGEGQHGHVPSADYKKELTIAIYHTGHIQEFDQRLQKLIQEDI